MAEKDKNRGMKLHKFIATGGKPKDFDGVNHDWHTTANNGPADKGKDKNPKK